MSAIDSALIQKPFMPLDARIYVPGHRGLVGSAVVRHLQSLGYHNLVLRKRSELDLRNAREVQRLFDTEKPEFVLLCAARVGGILANNTYPAEFYYDNNLIQTNVIHESYQHDVKRLLFLGSSCIYPRECPQPMREEHLLGGLLEPTNRPYALAKIGGIEMCWAYNRQYNTQYLAAMPTNLYGPGDNYDLHNSHVLPALIRRMYEAKVAGLSRVTLWGTGSPFREFLYSDDLADACVTLLNLPDSQYGRLINNHERAPLINIGSGVEVTIKELAETVCTVVGYRNSIVWDSTKPDGAPRKLLDISRIRQFGWTPTTELPCGVELAYHDYLANVYGNGRQRAA